MKNIIIFILLFSMFSCTENNKKLNIINKEQNDNVFLKGEELSEKEIIKINKNKSTILTKIDHISEEKEIIELEYPDIIKFTQIDIQKINKNLIEKDLMDKKLFIELGNSSHMKLEKILKIINKLSDLGKIDIFELHCNINTFNNNELSILENLKIKKFILQDTCGFRKKEFSRNWYKKEEILNFFKKAKNIKELDVGAIDFDIYKKKNGKIVEKLFF